MCPVCLVAEGPVTRPLGCPRAGPPRAGMYRPVSGPSHVETSLRDQRFSQTQSAVTDGSGMFISVNPSSSTTASISSEPRYFFCPSL